MSDQTDHEDFEFHTIFTNGPYLIPFGGYEGYRWVTGATGATGDHGGQRTTDSGVGDPHIGRLLGSFKAPSSFRFVSGFHVLIPDGL